MGHLNLYQIYFVKTDINSGKKPKFIAEQRIKQYPSY